ncbi:gluconate 2-dehydrogenase subunit 3 family protein [Microcystis elabens FACHB-917]|nr:gluconate 2-dehydrogenase subunit 3 family protein [Microcystis elabens FACHB-917]
MAAKILPVNHQYVLNHCAQRLSRSSQEARHNYNNQFLPGDPRASISEPWRFPFIDSYSSAPRSPSDDELNRVTFVTTHPIDTPPPSVVVVGSFHPLYQTIPLEPILFMGEPTGFQACTVIIPKQEVHTYRYIIDGSIVNDPVNPQERTLLNGETWSMFFTDGATELVTLQPWQATLLDRLTDHILPLRTTEGQQFLDFYYNFLDQEARNTRFPYAYRFDQSIGVVNYIDKMLSRHERHHLISYTICLEIIDILLRQRNPFIQPSDMPAEMYGELYDQMFSGNVPGWPLDRYDNPPFFLELLRRHTYTGAFSHPKYGGNAGGAGWHFLAGVAPFNWRQAIEAPLGTNTDYHG